MNEAEGKKMSQEDRLAARLRDNLRRRKAQSRAGRSESGGGSAGAGSGETSGTRPDKDLSNPAADS